MSNINRFVQRVLELPLCFANEGVTLDMESPDDTFLIMLQEMLPEEQRSLLLNLGVKIIKFNEQKSYINSDNYLIEEYWTKVKK